MDRRHSQRSIIGRAAQPHESRCSI